MTSRRATLLVGFAASVAALTMILWLATRGSGAEARSSSDASAATPGFPGTAADAHGVVDDAAPRAPAAAPGREAATSLSGFLRVSGEEVPPPRLPVGIENGPATTTDRQGRFVLSGLEPGRAELVIEAGEPFLPLRRAVDLGPGENHLQLELDLRFALDVTVVRHAPRTEEDGEPLPGAHVQLVVPSLSEAGSVHRLSEGVSDDRGRCSLADIPPGEHELHVEAPGFPATRLLLPFRYSGRSRESHLRTGAITVAVTTSSLPLRGRVLAPDRQPLGGALVCLDDPSLRNPGFARPDLRGARPAPATTFSAADGTFQLLISADASDVALLVCTRREDLAPVARHEVPHQHLQREQAVRVSRARPVELRVLDAGGRPARGRLQVSDGVLHYDLRSDPVLCSIPGFVESYAPPLNEEQGSLRLSLPEGGYRVRFDGTEPAGVLDTWFITIGPDAPQQVELRLGS